MPHFHKIRKPWEQSCANTELRMQSMGVGPMSLADLYIKATETWINWLKSSDITPVSLHSHLLVVPIQELRRILAVSGTAADWMPATKTCFALLGPALPRRRCELMHIQQDEFVMHPPLLRTSISIFESLTLWELEAR